MSNTPDGVGRTYTYKRYMRDGSVKEMTGVIRSRSKKSSTKEKKND